MKERLLWVSIMKTPKAEKLKSGNWRVQIMVNGKRYSLTAPTKKEAQQKAKEVYAGAELEKRIPLTVGKAIEKYIESKEGVLSPSTIRSYKAIRRNDLQSIMDTNISDLTHLDVQRAVSEDQIKGKSPKTIRNSHSLLQSVLKQVRPSFVLSTRLPQKLPKEIKIPTEEEMQLIWKEAEGTRYELPILIASWLGLRMSEIKGLRYEDIHDGYVYIRRSVVKGENGYVVKGTKTLSGQRAIKWPGVLDQKLHQYINDYVDSEAIDFDCYIFPFEGHLIYDALNRFCRSAGIRHYRFHDLRHFAASEAHYLGVPDKYAMQRMGHATDNMLKTVYQHTMKDKEETFADIIDDHMEELYYRSKE